MTYEVIKYIKGNPYRYLVRSVREGERVRQVFVRYLGRADKPSREYLETEPVERKERAKRPAVIRPVAEAVPPTVAVEAETPAPSEPTPPIEKITAPITKEPWQMERAEYNASIGKVNTDKIYYHATTSKEKFNKFTGKEVWFDTAPRDYGENMAQVQYDWNKPFVTSLQEAEEQGFKITSEQVAKNKEIYDELGGEANPKTFEWLREQGYDVVLDNEGYAALYPERVRILDWAKAESEFVNPNRIVKGFMHKAFVEKAIKEGKPVPVEVLKDYPELAPKPTPLAEEKPKTPEAELETKPETAKDYIIKKEHEPLLPSGFKYMVYQSDDTPMYISGTTSEEAESKLRQGHEVASVKHAVEPKEEEPTPPVTPSPEVTTEAGVIYHGSPVDFGAFDVGKQKILNEISGRGISFTEDPNLAKQYALGTDADIRMSRYTPVRESGFIYKVKLTKPLFDLTVDNQTIINEVFTGARKSLYEEELAGWDKSIPRTTAELYDNLVTHFGDSTNDVLKDLGFAGLKESTNEIRVFAPEFIKEQVKIPIGQQVAIPKAEVKPEAKIVVETLPIEPAISELVVKEPEIREITTETEVMPITPKVIGEQIAKELGIKYDGIQEGIGMQFTDPQTGSTTYGNTLEEVKTNLTKMRQKFEKVTPKPKIDPSLEDRITRLVPKLKRPQQTDAWTIALRDIPEGLGEELYKLGSPRSESWLRFGIKLKDGRTYKIDIPPAGLLPQLVVIEPEESETRQG